MPGSYADLLREAQARKQAEQKLDKIRDVVNDAGYAGLPSNIIAVIKQILDGDS